MKRLKKTRKHNNGGASLRSQTPISFNNILYGAGNFINPKTERECYSSLTNSIEVAKQFHTIKTDSDLLNNLEIGSLIGSGGFNNISSAIGIHNCKLHNKLKHKRHLLLIRISKEPIDETTNTQEDDTQKRSSVESSIQTRVNLYKDEMSVQASLANKGFMPNIYMCGVFRSTGKIVPGSGLHTFAIMERLGNSVNTLLLTSLDEMIWETTIQKTLKMYEMLARENVCNVDVKPENVVISLDSNGDIERLALIDVDGQFNIQVTSKQVRQSIMKIMFLLYIQKHILLFNKKTIPKEKYSSFVQIVQNELNKLDVQDIRSFYQILQTDDILSHTFKHYKLKPLADNLYHLRTMSARKTRTKKKIGSS